MKKLLLLIGFFAAGSISALAEGTAYCHCKLIGFETGISTGKTKAQFDLELMLASNTKLSRISTVGSYSGYASKNENPIKAYSLAEKKCEAAKRDQSVCY